MFYLCYRINLAEYAENYDLDNIITPIKVRQFVQELKNAQYDKKEIEYLEEGLLNGFEIGYDGPERRQSRAKNLPLKVGNKVELRNKLIKEVKLGRVAGPFDEIPFENFIQSPIGLVPKVGNKKQNQTRLIFHLSYNFTDSKVRENSGGQQDTEELLSEE